MGMTALHEPVRLRDQRIWIKVVVERNFCFHDVFFFFVLGGKKLG
jgi:hypothetical protein